MKNTWDFPSFVERAKKKKSFVYIRERIWEKNQEWKEKLSFQAGREILIKAVIQAMPTFTMNCFKLPKCLCKDIESLIQKFWWGYRDNARKIHWMRWKKLCLPKTHGGLGIKDLEQFKFGGSSTTLTPLTRFSKPTTSQIAPFWMGR